MSHAVDRPPTRWASTTVFGLAAAVVVVLHALVSIPAVRSRAVATAIRLERGQPARATDEPSAAIAQDESLGRPHGSGICARAVESLPVVGRALGFCLVLANAFFLFNLFVRRGGGPLFIGLAMLGYGALFVVFFPLVQTPLLFLLFVMVYSGTLHRPVLAGYLLLFVVSFVLLPPYSVSVFVGASLTYAGVVQIAQGSRSMFMVVCFVLGAALLTVVLMPVIHLCTQSTAQTLLFTLRGEPSGPGSESWEVRQSLKTSLTTATVATLIVAVLGVPLSYAMVRCDFKGRAVIDALIDLPILVPPLVAGIALLLLLGPDAPLGALMQRWFGARLDGSLAGIIAAQVFVGSPFLVRTAMTAFEAIDPRLERVARTLGASPMRVFFSISLPLALRGIMRGSALTWARAISEFGSLLVIAYRPFTAPTLIYNRFTERGIAESTPIAALLVLTCFWVFVLTRFAGWRPLRRLSSTRTEGAQP